MRSYMHNYALKSLLILGILALLILPKMPFGQVLEPRASVDEDYGYQILGGTSVLATNPSVSKKVSISNPDTYTVIATAYTSVPEQTDDTPFITAAGTYTRDGVIAANFLPLGTVIKIPELYGDKVFVVEDRMHPRNYGKVDIWFSSNAEAKNFGRKWIQIEVL